MDRWAYVPTCVTLAPWLSVDCACALTIVCAIVHSPCRVDEVTCLGVCLFDWCMLFAAVCAVSALSRWCVL